MPPPPDVPGFFVGAAADGVMLRHETWPGIVELPPQVAIGLACKVLHAAAVVEQQRETRENGGPDRTETSDTG